MAGRHVNSDGKMQYRKINTVVSTSLEGTKASLKLNHDSDEDDVYQTRSSILHTAYTGLKLSSPYLSKDQEVMH